MLTMKKLVGLNRISIYLSYVFIISLSIQACAQKSPQANTEKKVNGVTIKIDYHSPSVRDRIIWGDLVPYDQVWRTGANNATTFEVDKEVTIANKTVPAGKYALFTIPKKGAPWVVILNKEADQWGAYNYNESEDLMRFTVEAKRQVEMTEEMTFDIDDEGNVSFSWEYLTFQFPVKTN